MLYETLSVISKLADVVYITPITSNAPINSPHTIIGLVDLVYSSIDLRKTCDVAITAVNTIPLNVAGATFESQGSATSPP